MLPGSIGPSTGGAAYRNGRKIRPDETGMRPAVQDTSGWPFPTPMPVGYSGGGTGGGTGGTGGTGGEGDNGYPNMPVVTNLAPFMGNNQQLLASQLNAGFGGGVDMYNQRMDQTYRPTHSVGLFEPLTETKNALQDGNYDMSGTTGLLALDRVLGFDVPGANTDANAKSLFDSPAFKRKRDMIRSAGNI